MSLYAERAAVFDDAVGEVLGVRVLAVLDGFDDARRPVRVVVVPDVPDEVRGVGLDSFRCRDMYEYGDDVADGC